MNTDKHVCQVAFSALDAFALRDWYYRVFGFLRSGQTVFFPPATKRVQGIDGAWERCGWLVDQQDYFQLEFFQFLSPRSRPRRSDYLPTDIGFSTIGIVVRDFDAALAGAASNGSSPLSEPAGAAGDRRVCLRDPEGNFIEVFEKDPCEFTSSGIVRPDVPALVRSIRLSVPDLAEARRTFGEALGLLPLEGFELNGDEHEALWGLSGVKCERATLRSDNFMVELVQYREPEPRAWPPGYRICDQGFMNIALGYRSRHDFVRSFDRAVSRGLRPNGKPVDIGVFRVMYVNDPAGFSVEMLYARESLWSVSGFNPQEPYVVNDVWIDAPVDRVWEAVTDHARFGEWTAFDAKVLREGSDHSNGTGCLREVKGPGMTLEEEVTEWRPPHFYRYRLTKGAPIKNHRGEIMLTPEGSGCRVRWVIRFDAAFPGTGKLTAFVLRLTFAAALRKLGRKLEPLRH